MRRQSDRLQEWNGAMGERWAAMRQEIDRFVVPFGRRAEARGAAAGSAGDRHGCGRGHLIELARLVGGGRGHRHRRVAAMRRLPATRALANYAHLDFRDGDASEAALPANTDLLFSRFGVMFFSQPSPAFSHMRKSLRAGGRCVFVCWRTPRDNPWAMTPLSAARAAMGVTPAPADPDAPGPFAFADEERLRGILSRAGFGAIDVQRFDVAISLGATPRSAAEQVLQIGPVSRLVREVGRDRSASRFAIGERSPARRDGGHVSLNGRTDRLG